MAKTQRAQSGTKRKAADAAPSNPPPTKKGRSRLQREPPTILENITARAAPAKKSTAAPKRGTKRGQPETTTTTTTTTSERPAKKRKAGPEAERDAFRVEALSEIQALKPEETSLQAKILPFLEKVRPLQSTRIVSSVAEAEREGGVAPDAYNLTPADARSLLRGNTIICAPVFVVGGAKEILEIGEGEARPIEHALEEWFLDPDEIHNRNHVGVKIENIRKHFLTRKKSTTRKSTALKDPWNFPDIPNPIAHRAAPSFVESINCNLLRDIIRIVLDVSESHVCPDDCPRRAPETPDQCCETDKHELTLEEYVTLQDGSKMWDGTLMLADAGALTLPHWDQWALGTWISAYEGEMGLAWLSHPRAGVRDAWQRDTARTAGTWLYRVLCPGDSVYLPPGTVHLVFRKPRGCQTMGMAGNMLRRTDLVVWLETLWKETEVRVEQDEVGSRRAAALMVRPLVKAAEALLHDYVGTAKTRDRLGGSEKVERAKVVVGLLIGLLPSLIREESTEQNRTVKVVKGAGSRKSQRKRK
jgi:hypothetical protein